MNVMEVDMNFKRSVVEEMTWLIIGCSCCPSATAISVTPLRALSSPA